MCRLSLLLLALPLAQATIGFCNDKDISCAAWSRDGLCDTDDVVKGLCPHRCGVCRGVCKDTHDDCPGWAKDGECLSNPGHTMKSCPFSCGVTACKAEHGCADKNSTACAIWALDDECLKNPGHTMKSCPFS